MNTDSRTKNSLRNLVTGIGSNILLIVIRFVIPVFANVVAIAKQTLVVTKVGVVLLPHLFRGLSCGFNSVVPNLFLARVLVHVGINAKRAPSVSCNKKVYKNLPFF